MDLGSALGIQLYPPVHNFNVGTQRTRRSLVAYKQTASKPFELLLRKAWYNYITLSHVRRAHCSILSREVCGRIMLSHPTIHSREIFRHVLLAYHQDRNTFGRNFVMLSDCKSKEEEITQSDNFSVTSRAHHLTTIEGSARQEAVVEWSLYPIWRFLGGKDPPLIPLHAEWWSNCI